MAGSEATKQPSGHSAAVCGPLAPHVLPPLDCFVARAPRNDGAANVARVARASFPGATSSETHRAAGPAMTRPRRREPDTNSVGLPAANPHVRCDERGRETEPSAK